MIRRPSAILLLLTGLNLLNYIDRYVVTAVAPKIQESMGLDFTRTALVTTAFMLGYFLTSPIFGWLGDRYPRKALIAGGVAVWSIATIASGLAHSYYALLAARVVVGVGEASYATLSPTIIDDLSSKENKNRWLAVFYVAIPVGSALGFMIGGELQKRFGWQNAFFIVGGPGIVLAAVTLLIEEPPRAAFAVTKQGAWGELWRRPAYRATVIGYVAQTFALGGFTALANQFLYHKHAFALDKADFWFGATAVVTGLVGTAFGGYLADRWPGRDRARAAIRVCAWSSLIGAPFALAALFAGTPPLFLVLLGICELAIFSSVAPTNAALMSTVPSHLRVRAMAASIFAIHLFGDLISPPIVAHIADAVGEADPSRAGGPALQIGMYLLPAAVLISAIVWWRGSARDAVEIDGDDAPAPQLPR